MRVSRPAFVRPRVSREPFVWPARVRIFSGRVKCDARVAPVRRIRFEHRHDRRWIGNCDAEHRAAPSPYRRIGGAPPCAAICPLPSWM